MCIKDYPSCCTEETVDGQERAAQLVQNWKPEGTVTSTRRSEEAVGLPDTEAQDFLMTDKA